MSKTKPERHLDICKEINDLYAKKNHDYGDSFHQTFVEEGFAMSRIRLSDKFNRFKTLSRGTEAAVKDESIRDTLIDLANYAIMTVLEMDDAEREADNDILAGIVQASDFQTRENPVSVTRNFDSNSQRETYRIESKSAKKLEYAYNYAKTVLADVVTTNEITLTPLFLTKRPDGISSFEICILSTATPKNRIEAVNAVYTMSQEKYTSVSEG